MQPASFGEWMECTERNLITRVLAIYHVKLMQSSKHSLEVKRFYILLLSAALRNLRQLLVS